MATLRNFVTTATTIALAVGCFATPRAAHAGLGKWFKKELVPSITGERPLKIKPYVSIKHKGKMRLKLGTNSAYIQIAGVTVKTHQLRKRLAQAGCVIETGGNVMLCAPDIVHREVQNLAQEARRSGVRGTGGHGSGGALPPQGGVGTVQPIGWTRWVPKIAVACRFNDGFRIGVSADGYLHAASPAGYSSPVGTVRGSFNPHVRFVLQNGRGYESPVLHDGTVLDQSATRVVGSCWTL